MSIPKAAASARLTQPEVMRELRRLAKTARRGSGIRVPALSEVRARIAARRSDRYLGGADAPEYLTLAEAALVLFRSKACVRQMVRGGRIRGHFVPAEESGKSYGYWQISAEDVRSLAAAEDQQ